MQILQKISILYLVSQPSFDVDKKEVNDRKSNIFLLRSLFLNLSNKRCTIYILQYHTIE